MRVRESRNGIKPKNFSRKVFICSCQCPIVGVGNDGGYANVKYEVEPNKDMHYVKTKYPTPNWYTPECWGQFKRVIELPPIFSKLNDEDFIVYTGFFMRDNVQMPSISHIEIVNKEKYKIIKLKESRKEKINRINYGK